jgi:hypothetical protein
VTVKELKERTQGMNVEATLPEKPDELWLLWDPSCSSWLESIMEEEPAILAYTSEEKAQQGVIKLCEGWEQPCVPVRVL